MTLITLGAAMAAMILTLPARLWGVFDVEPMRCRRGRENGAAKRYLSFSADVTI